MRACEGTYLMIREALLPARCDSTDVNCVKTLVVTVIKTLIRVVFLLCH